MIYFAKTRFECECISRWHWLFVESTTCPNEITKIKYCCPNAITETNHRGQDYLTSGLHWSEVKPDFDGAFILSHVIADE